MVFLKVIGLCGGSGSGKGTVASLLSELGIPTIDTDLVYRELTSAPSDCLRALCDEFGDGVIGTDGALDRAFLRAHVFEGDGAEQRRLRLNEITHFHILAETRRRLARFSTEGFFAATVDAPLLYESGFDRECDAVIAVLADRATRIARITERDGITPEAAAHRVDTQIADGELIQRADFIIVNDGDRESLKTQVLAVAEKIQNL